MKPSAELPATSAPKSAPSRLEVRITSGRSLELGKPLGDLEPVEVRQLHVDDRQVRAVCLRLPDATRAGSGFGHDDEAGSLEQPSRRRAEGAVVIDDENAASHRLIVPAGGCDRVVWLARLFFAAAAASVMTCRSASEHQG